MLDLVDRDDCLKRFKCLVCSAFLNQTEGQALFCVWVVVDVADARVGQECTARVEDLRKQDVDLHQWELTRVFRFRQVVPCHQHFKNQLQVALERAKLLFVKMHLDYDVLQLSRPHNVQQKAF